MHMDKQKQDLEGYVLHANIEEQHSEVQHNIS